MEQRNYHLSFKKKVTDYLKQCEQRGYANGIPDEADLRLEQLNKAPSYRKICNAILKNDYQLSTLGYTKQKTKTYHILKRIDLVSRGKIIKPNELF